LVLSGVFQQVDEGLIKRLEECALGEQILSLYEYPTGLIHGDLRAENVFLLQSGRRFEDRLRVIDWQRPLRGPILIDQATLLESLGIDPIKFICKGAVQARDFLTVCWCAECASRWYPSATPTYDRIITELAAKVI
jgi:aminoglycoside phosphotransferase (APT) family kinase protein